MRELNEIVGSNLQELRKSRHLTQQELAEQIGYSDKSISKWELGKAIPTVDVLIDFGSFFGVSLDYLVTEREPTEVQKTMNQSLKARSNQFILIALMVCFVFAVAGAIYITNVINHREPDLWISFVWAIPATFLLASLMCHHFWKRNISFYVCLSCFVWSLMLAFHLQYYFYYPFENLWYLYLLMIPVQIGIILVANLK